MVYPSLKERRSLYREDLAGIIDQHQADSRRYRRVHYMLQSLIMVGSGTTTVAALDSGSQLTWQNITLVIIGFAVTLAAAFTGYYKYRERSYFLQHTADAIEEEANAFTLGVGRYRVHPGPGARGARRVHPASRGPAQRTAAPPAAAGPARRTGPAHSSAAGLTCCRPLHAVRHATRGSTDAPLSCSALRHEPVAAPGTAGQSLTG
ncbi:DUF4231 domain-containing protein [Streptomyces sp. NPDC058086]|uniref:DUF4231 domain-containing protein n=1 Tax=Streptomyces sp. NPDC058086 TaxID=3346334 RepID=UPI0036E9A6C1